MEAKRRRHRGMLAATVSVVAVALLAPGSSSAAVTIGQVNPAQPAGGGSCLAGDVYTTRKSAATIISAAPSAGVITSWSTRATDTPGQQAQLKTISQTGAPGVVTYTVRGTSALESLTPSTLNTFSTRIPVQAGQGIGYLVANGADNDQACTFFSADNNNEVAAAPSAGQVGNSFTDVDGNSNKVVNLSARLEPDADGDGFGDETQDRCPGVAGPNGGCATGSGGGGSDTQKPSISSLSLSNTTFKVGKSGSVLSSRRKKHYPTGTKVSFSLSEAASVRFTVQRKTSGRKVSGKCKTKTRSNRRKKKCTLWKSVRGSLTVSGKAGKNSFTFLGRIGGRALRKGSYRLSATATDPAKNASLPKRKGFRIVK